jgi:quinoprotein glucose dehydrogenase
MNNSFGQIRLRKLVASFLLCVSPPMAGWTQDTGAAKNWSSYGGGPGSLHYSKLKQIDKENVASLKVAWTFDTGDAVKGLRTEFEATPLAVNGVLYMISPKVRLFAVDATTGKQFWVFDPAEGRKTIGSTRNRGLSYWTDGKDERLFVSLKQYLYAVDAKTGKLIETFGDKGKIDLSKGLGHDGEGLAISISTPGTVYKDLLICGSIVAEQLPALPGDIRAFDVRTGKVRWQFHTIPHPGEPGYETWPKDAYKYSGAANNWAGLSVDTKRGLAFIPLGSASSDFYGADRIGDDLYANSLLVLDANTGKRVWHFQTVHHDIWDRDLNAPPTLVTLHKDGKTIDAVAQTTKTGFVFVFDRETGKPIFPIEERSYLASDIPGEIASKTQPLPIAPPPFARQRIDEKDITMRTPEAHAEALAKFRLQRNDGPFIPANLTGTILFPGMDGGQEWGGPSFDPETGLLYTNANEMAWILSVAERPPLTSTSSGKQVYENKCAACHRSDRSGALPEVPSLIGIDQRYTDREISKIVKTGNGRMPAFAALSPQEVAAVTAYVLSGRNDFVAAPAPDPLAAGYVLGSHSRFLDIDGYPAIAPPWGTLSAIDLNKGAIAWQIPFGEYPELAAKGLKNTGSENYGGGVVTAGGLFFIGATNYDAKFHAFDKSNGKLLWETTLPAAGNATPAVYEAGGREFVVIAAGGGKNAKAESGGSYVAFALPETQSAKQRALN